MVTRHAALKKARAQTQYPYDYGIIRRELVCTCYSKNPIRLPIPDANPVISMWR